VSDAELLSNPDFQALCARWQADGRAPLPGADWFTERGLYGEAAWEFAATEPDREDTDDSFATGGIYPWNLADDEWGWYCADLDERDDLSSAFNESQFQTRRLFPSFPAAILWFLRRSAEVYGSDGPTRTVTHEAVAT
jgi:hypothetical protein